MKKIELNEQQVEYLEYLLESDLNDKFASKYSKKHAKQLLEKLNEEYWDGVNSGSIFPDGMEYDDEYYKSPYLPTQQEEDENFKQTLKQNGYTS